MSQTSSEFHRDNAELSFFSNILTPGSSLHPTFLLTLDVIFLALLLTLLGLVFATAGNIHLIALTGIELALWASVKWLEHTYLSLIEEFR
ncbi:hypothetical protein J3R30DRAFT_3299027 [Lentinula aciculospora]|uniref:Uncharacterized protein n=1 Tax=Lentinula aciculospora TaxID=153920 RepID=A0A9W9A2N7_9AGAR|nr:hypothetical protein J3R30DRAFT_3299027 [Lentinula aciculospora]